MNLFSLIYSSSLIYPKDEEKRRNVSYLRLPEVLRKFKTGPCGTFQVSAPRGSLMPRQHAQREHRTRRLGLTEEEEMRRVRRILVLLQAKQYKQKMGRALEPCTGPITPQEASCLTPTRPPDWDQLCSAPQATTAPPSAGFRAQTA